MIRCFEHIDLRDRNSFHVVQHATALAEFDNPAELSEIFARYKGMPRIKVLSGGNNILFTRDFDGLLITPCGQGIAIIDEEDDRVTVRAEAGVEWDDFVAWCVDRELWGAENLSLIPGKVGAAPVQNIGAYGAEAKDIIKNVEMYAVESDNFITLAAEHCAFGYRDSVFKNLLADKIVITAVEFTLSRRPQPRLGYGDVIRETEARGGATLKNIRDAICSIRRSKLPDTAVLGNAGSFFKNPVVEASVVEALLSEHPEMPHWPTPDGSGAKLAAGWLIDKAGMKGFRSGNVGVHDRQALVLVNFGGATGAEVMELAHTVQQRVKELFGIDMHTEVNIL